MSAGNMVLSNGCSWSANKLNIPSNGSAISTGKPTIGQDGSFTFSIAFKVNSYKSADYQTSYIAAIKNILSLRIYINNYTPKLLADVSTDTLTIAVSDMLSNMVIDIVHTNNYHKVYLNGQLAATYNRQGSTLSILNPISLACIANSNGVVETNGQCDEDIYAVNFYSRELIPEEIEQNFNTYNSRFNLGL